MSTIFCRNCCKRGPHQAAHAAMPHRCRRRSRAVSAKTPAWTHSVVKREEAAARVLFSKRPIRGHHCGMWRPDWFGCFHGSSSVRPSIVHKPNLPQNGNHAFGGNVIDDFPVLVEIVEIHDRSGKAPACGFAAHEDAVVRAGACPANSNHRALGDHFLQFPLHI